MIYRPRFLVKNYLRISGSRHSALDTARGRVVLINAFFVLLFILISARVFDLSVIQRDTTDIENVHDYNVSKEFSAPETFRADILDRNGVMLASTIETSSLYADPSLITEREKVARKLTEVIPDLSYGDALKKLQKNARFVWLKRSLSPQQQYKILEMGEPGLGFKTERRRVYPQGILAPHFVGYSNIDGKGLAGIERSFNNLLAKGGEPITLTIDTRLQHVLRREMLDAVTEFSAKAAAGVIVDIANGEILSAVSLPDFDPHRPGDYDESALFNRLSLASYELGSTFKIFSTAALLEHKKVSMSQKFDATEPLKRGRHIISDYHPEERVLSLPEVFMFSSNIGSALMGEMIGTDALKSFYEDLGLMAPLSLEIDEVGKPILPSVWRDINTLTASYGHGIAVSPLQMVIAASSIVNGGILIKPSLVLDKHGAKKPQSGTDLRIVSPQTAHRMRQLMRLVVTDGTGAKADVPGYSVGGKTGTAEKIVNGRYDRKKKISSFIGFFPMHEPRYAVFIMVDEPMGTKKSFGYATGGWVAAPAVGRVISAMAPILGLEPSKISPQEDIASSLKKYVSFKEEEGALATY